MAAVQWVHAGPLTERWLQGSGLWVDLPTNWAGSVLTGSGLPRGRPTDRVPRLGVLQMVDRMAALIGREGLLGVQRPARESGVPELSTVSIHRSMEGAAAGSRSPSHKYGP